MAQQEARRRSLEERKRGNKSAVRSGVAASHYSQPVARDHQVEPQLFTQKLLAQTIDPPPPPPGRPSPRKKSPRRKSFNNACNEPPPPPPITPRTPGGSLRPAFAEAPATTPRNPHSASPQYNSSLVEGSSTPTGSSFHKSSPRHVLGEPSPTSRTPKTPKSPANSIFAEPSFRRSPTGVHGNAPLSSPLGRDSPVGRYGTSFGYGSDTVCDLISQNSTGDTTLGLESLEEVLDENPPAPSPASKEEKQRKDRTLFQKSFLEATNNRSNDTIKSPKESVKRMMGYSKNAACPLQEVISASNNNQPNERRNSNLSSPIASPITIITKQSFSPEPTRRSSSGQGGAFKDDYQRPQKMEPFELLTSSVSAHNQTFQNKKVQKSLGASWQQILQLPTRCVTRKDILSFQQTPAKANRTCFLCSRSFRVKDVIRSLPCEHHFHTNCIDPYLFLQAQCPICKHPSNTLEL
jgi:Ring finger domain